MTKFISLTFVGHDKDKRSFIINLYHFEDSNCLKSSNGTERFKNVFKKVKNHLNTNIYSYLEAPGGQSSNLYLNVVHCFNTRVN